MKEQVITVIKNNLLEILPELEDIDFSMDDIFSELGADSVDRGELITLTLEVLELDIPRVDFVRAKTGNELADLILAKTPA